MRKLSVLLLIMVMAVSVSATAFAKTGKVTYDGEAEEFIFKPGSEESLTDLFPEFKDVMPGDTLTQKITVKNDASKKVKVKIYIRSLGSQKKSKDFLSQLHLKVKKSDDNDKAYMFDAAADKKADLADWTLLGTLYSGGKVNLDVTLEVPVELDNEYMDEIGYLDWEFAVEEFPMEEKDPTAADTGDDALLGVWMAVAAVSMLFLIILLLKRRKNNCDE